MEQRDLEYLKLLSKQYPTVQAASTEIINLKAILSLPKGTEHFMSDIHGEYESFVHILNNASGVIKRKIYEIFHDSLRKKEKDSLATLIYYPVRKLKIIKKQEKNIDEWYRLTLYRLVQVCRVVSSKYTRSKVRKSLPNDFAYIIEELLHEHEHGANKQHYYEGIINTIIQTDRADKFIIAICGVIRNLSIDRLHIVGDIYDRGPNPDLIIDKLLEHKAIDIQWGNHDIIWIGASIGIEALIATVLRIAARYDNLSLIEEGYGINLRPLATFAMQFYKDDPCKPFQPKLTGDQEYSEHEISIVQKMHKAIAIIQFKLDAQIIKRNPEFKMDNRLLLDKINFDKGVVTIDGKEYPLNDTNFPTVDPKDPYKLTHEEADLVERLKSSFQNSNRLRRHTKLFFNKGGLYLAFNSNLLYHGCIPMTKEGEFQEVDVNGKKLSGKALSDELDKVVRKCFFSDTEYSDSCSRDYVWYLWSGPYSPLFGKTQMTTFERYFVDDKNTHKEEKNPYFDLRNEEKTVRKILEEFGLNPESSHIINGHVPVKWKAGENPVKGNGKLIVIDGGLSRAYQPVTGIAGYTLIYNSYGLILAAHKPFKSTKTAIEEDDDIFTSQKVLENNTNRKRVKDTDVGLGLSKQIHDLEQLLLAYRKGKIKEKTD